MASSPNQASRAAELAAQLRARRKGAAVSNRGMPEPGVGRHTSTKPVAFEARPHKAKV